MRPLRYSINVSLDGCVDHAAFRPDEEFHRHHQENLERADALLYGRVIYQMMEEAWRPAPDGSWADWMEGWMIPFAESIDRAEKYVVSNTLDDVDWNATLVRGDDLGEAVSRLKAQDGEGIATSGVTLPLALAELGLIDEYEFVVVPTIAGHGPRPFDGLRDQVDLELIERQELRSGAVSLRYRPRPVS